MLRRLAPICMTDVADETGSQAPISLKISLWLTWVLALVGFVGLRWYSAMAAQRPLDLLGLAIHTVLAGLVGVIIVTLIEMRFKPERFVE